MSHLTELCESKPTKFRGGSVALLYSYGITWNFSSFPFVLVRKFQSRFSKYELLPEKKILSINNFMHHEDIHFNSYFQIINRPRLKAMVFALKEDENNAWVGCQRTRSGRFNIQQARIR